MNTVTNPLISAFSFGLFATTNLLIFQLTLRAIFLILSVGVVPQNRRTSYLLLMNKCFFIQLCTTQFSEYFCCFENSDFLIHSAPCFTLESHQLKAAIKEYGIQYYCNEQCNTFLAFFNTKVSNTHQQLSLRTSRSLYS